MLFDKIVSTTQRLGWIAVACFASLAAAQQAESTAAQAAEPSSDAVESQAATAGIEEVVVSARLFN